MSFVCCRIITLPSERGETPRDSVGTTTRNTHKLYCFQQPRYVACLTATYAYCLDQARERQHFSFLFLFFVCLKVFMSHLLIHRPLRFTPYSLSCFFSINLFSLFFMSLFIFSLPLSTSSNHFPPTLLSLFLISLRILICRIVSSTSERLTL